MVRTIKLVNVGPFKDLEINLKKNLSIIFGENGTGKTTILSSILSMWGIWHDYHKKCIPTTTHGFKESIIKIFQTEDLNKSEDKDTFIVLQYYYPSRKAECITRFPDDIKGIKLLLIAINAYRKFNITDVAGPSKEPDFKNYELLERSINLFSHNINSYIHNWLVNKHFFSKEEWGKKDKKELEFFKEKLMSLFSSEIKFKTINRFMEPVFETPTGDTPLYLLSSGIQSICYILFEIIYEMSMFYRESDNIFLEKALVLIDEIEAHLHPRWQKFISRSLTEIFPNCQFIITTHSPVIISTCEEGEIIHLKFGEKGEILCDYPQSPEGWLSENILTDLMGLSSSRSIKVEKDIEKLEDLYYKKFEGNLPPEEQKELTRLQNKLATNLPEDDPVTTLTKLEALERKLREKNN